MHKLILVLILTLSLAMASEPSEGPVSGQDNVSIMKAAQEAGQNQTANNSFFLEDFNSVNNPYKETLFATGQAKRNESINSYENLTSALAVFQEKYKDYRPAAIASDELFYADMANASAIISDAKDGIYTGNLTEVHSQLEGVRPIFQKILVRNGLMPLSVALVDFHDVMEEVLDGANNKDTSMVLEVYPKADEKLKAVEAISSDPGIKSIRANLDEVMSLAKENKAEELPVKAGDLKASYVKVYLATS